MWIILIARSLEEHRDRYINSILSEQNITEVYLSDRYGTTTMIDFAKIYKKESGAIKFINNFLEDKKVDYSYRSKKYDCIRNYHLSIRELKKDEWNKIIDNQVNREKILHNRKIIKLLSKKVIIS